MEEIWGMGKQTLILKMEKPEALWFGVHSQIPVSSWMTLVCMKCGQAILFTSWNCCYHSEWPGCSLEVYVADLSIAANCYCEAPQ